MHNLQESKQSLEEFQLVESDPATKLPGLMQLELQRK
jgi:hypothetical protein